MDSKQIQRQTEDLSLNWVHINAVLQKSSQPRSTEITRTMTKHVAWRLQSILVFSSHQLIHLHRRPRHLCVCQGPRSALNGTSSLSLSDQLERGAGWMHEFWVEVMQRGRVSYPVSDSYIPAPSRVGGNDKKEAGKKKVRGGGGEERWKLITSATDRRGGHPPKPPFITSIRRVALLMGYFRPTRFISVSSSEQAGWVDTCVTNHRGEVLAKECRPMH